MRSVNFLILTILLLLNSGCSAATKQQATFNPVDMVYPHLDSENSRWFFFSTACRPFGMVNLSPDTQVGGAWGSGYRYNTDTIKGFSHIHAWQLAGLSVMPVVMEKNNPDQIFTDFYSRFSHQTEKAEVGYHYLELDRYAVQAELTSTKRVGFHRYSFPEKSMPSVLFNLNGILGPCNTLKGSMEQTDKNTLSGKFDCSPTVRRPKPVTVFFHVKLNAEIEHIKTDRATGNYLLTLEKPKGNKVLMKAAISYTSAENAANNMKTELSHWDFDAVVADSKAEWNSMLSRIKVEGGTSTDQRRFYTDLWHALQGRRVISDANGAYPDNTGDLFRIGQIPLNDKDEPKFNHYNSDSFWGAQWTLNTLWGLIYPEIYKEFVQSMMQYYKDGGRVPRGPSGGNYTFVMTGATATPFIVSAIQKGIVKEGLEEIYKALKKGHMPGGIMSKAGYEHKTEIGGGLEYYIENGYVPHPNPKGMRFGFHQNGPGMTLEYAYQDWTLAQLAKKLGHDDDYNYFMQRAENYKNVYDKESGWMRPKDIDGNWLQDFDPYDSPGFVEANPAQGTWFVGHDIEGLAALMGGKDAAAAKLNRQFEKAEKLGFTAGDAHAKETHPEYRRIPINYGNQPSIQTAFIFNRLDRPDQTQYWSKKVAQTAFNGFATNSGYNGDEDQGLMGSLAVIYKLGLFQLNGGTEENPEYQLGSPMFDKVTLQLNPDYYPGKRIIINTEYNSPDSYKVLKASFNNEPLDDFTIRHETLVEGGELMFEYEKK
ncbi:MAG: GH92 family glycosyl hydrolase [Prolixibacteraceae bacterium]